MTTTDRNFKINLPHRLLFAVRGADQTPHDADAKPSTAIGRPPEPIGSMPAERNGPCTWEIGGWVSPRNGRARAEGGGGEGRRKSRPLPQITSGHPDRRSTLPRGERPPLALLQRADRAVPRWRRGPCRPSEGAEPDGDVGEITAKLSDVSGGQTHRLFSPTPAAAAEHGCCSHACHRGGATLPFGGDPRALLGSTVTATGREDKQVGGDLECGPESSAPRTTGPAAARQHNSRSYL